MKFGDKLIQLRKKSGMNQEELAEKLGVSRQSVSKWESNNAYPETDKIVQICNIFNCSMDDLINDHITDINEIQRKDKNNVTVVIDSFLEFITKTVNMFSSMKFTSGLKCIIEMIILALILALFGNIVSGIFSSCIGRIFAFNEIHTTIEHVFYSLLMVAWTIIEIIVLVHTFKIRYLDYYDKTTETKEENNEVENVTKKTNDKNEKIVIRDANHKPFAFLSVLSSIIIIFAKIILAIFSIEIIAVIVSCAVALVVSIFLTPTSTLFLGADLSILSVIVASIIILIFIIAFIFNKKVNFKALLITFLLSIVTSGIGIGIAAISVKDFKIDDKPQYTKTTTEEMDYTDNLVTVTTGLPDTEYTIDNSVNNIKLEISYNDKLSEYEIKRDTYYGLNTLEVHEISKELSPKEAYDLVIPNLKKHIIKVNYDAIKIRVISNEETINKLIDNASKVYTFDVENIENGYILRNIGHKINENDSCTEKTEYNAVTGEITTSGECKCSIKEVENYLEFNCNYGE
ncbi:MAG: helix-turn-helix transcriptional regulator [Bacilli bacterium]|nr:helix-turn-helix transcriptional regulator [Bacilli bacterium]